MIETKLKQLIKSVTAFVVALNLLLGQAMAASADLHQHCHHHSDDPAHQCVVTLMLHGGYGDETPDIEPVDVKPEAPLIPACGPMPAGLPPFHLLGGVLAQAPPRGP